MIIRELGSSLTFEKDYIDAWLDIQDGNPSKLRKNFDFFNEIANSREFHDIVVGVSRERCEKEWPGFSGYDKELRADIICYLQMHDQYEALEEDTHEDNTYKAKIVLNSIDEYHKVACRTNPEQYK